MEEPEQARPSTKHPKNMAAELAALRAGTMSPDAFARATQGQWEAIAQSIVRRWELPPGVDADDARQELLLALFEKGLASKWDPRREIELSRHVVWGTCSGAKDWLHKQRGALRHRGTAPSRFPLPASSLMKPGSERSVLDTRADAAPDSEREVSAREEVGALVARMPGRIAREALLALLESGGDEGAAAELIVREPDRAIACSAGSLKEARAAVRVALELARGMACAPSVG